MLKDEIVKAAIVSTNGVTVVIDEQVTPITDSHPNYGEIRRLAAAGTYTAIPALLNIVASIEDFGAGAVTVENGVVLYKGMETHNTITTRILQFIDEGLTVGPMLAFMENLMLNPSFRAVKELYGFMEANDLPITHDGYVLGYKMVNRKADGTLTDIRTGTFDYSVGAVAAEMPRNEVNEDPNQTCEAGLHVCAQEYLGSGYSNGDCTILVKVHPMDVVAVPTDYHDSKMRVCKHETVCEVKPNTRGNVFTSAVLQDDDVERLAVTATTTEDTTLADDANVMSFDNALAHFDCNRGALLKRLNRGKTAKRVYQGGTEMVQLIEADAPVVDTPVADDTVSVDEALAHFDCDRAALRKRCVRGVTAEWDDSGDERRVRILPTD